MLDIMHCCSHTTMDSGIPTMPGQSMSGLYRPSRHCLDKAGRAIRYPASRMKGGLRTGKNACDTMIARVRSRWYSLRTNGRTRPTTKEKRKKRYAGCLSQAVGGMFTASLPTDANPPI